MDVAELQSLSLKLLVHKVKNEVVFAEANHDFVDVLFSFMTIPVGAVIKLIGDQSFSCMSNLCASIENFDENLLSSKTCREVLLHPRSAAEIYCRNLKLNWYETDGNEYYVCGGFCECVCYYWQDGFCLCGNRLWHELRLPSPSPTLLGGFTKSTSRFMITSDLNVRPISTMKGLTLLKLLGAGEKNALEERTVNVGKEKILELLKFSLASKRPLTEAFLNLIPLKIGSCSVKIGSVSNSPGKNEVSSSAKTEETISLKLIINSVNNTVLYAEAASDFVNLLCSFLTFPIGFLFQKNVHFPFNGCMDNVYKSINNLEVELFKSPMMKETLLEAKLAPGLALLKKVISIEDTTNPTRTDLICHYKAETCNINSKSCYGEPVIAKGFAKGPSSFMIMDNLAVMPLSSISGLCLIETMQIPFDKIVEKEMVMGETEAIRLFTASLVAENALTDVFLRDEIKQERERG